MSAGGLEIYGAVGVSIQLIKTASTCLGVVRRVRKVGQLAKEQNDAHLRLLVQAYMFERWCAVLDIQEMQKAVPQNGQTEPEGDSAQSAQIKSTLESQLSLNNPSLVVLLVDSLKTMEARFSQASNIIRKYCAQPDTQKNAPRRTGRAGILTMMAKPFRKTPTSSLINSHSSWPSTEDTGVLSKGGSNIALRTVWVASDKNTIHELLKEIETINKLLVDLLSPELRPRVSRQTVISVLDNEEHTAHMATTTATKTKTKTMTTTMGSISPDGDDLQMMAKVKQWQMRERMESQGNESTTMAAPLRSGSMENLSERVTTFRTGDFKRGSFSLGENRSMTTLDDEQVLVEWKYCKGNSPSLDQILRLGRLVGLLNRNDLFIKFLSLPCKGLVDEMENSRIGIILSTQQTATRRVQTLKSFIHDTATGVPIGDRFTLAKDLVTAIHNLHSVQWLHKSIRSDNIVCFLDDDEPAKNGQADLTEAFPPDEEQREGHPTDITTMYSRGKSLTAPPPALPKFHLVGWDLSRPDHPSELSETLSISTAGYQNKRDTVRMYSHPDMHKDVQSGQRPRYRPQFDIYSLGLILLEIGLWRTIDTMQQRPEVRLRFWAEYCDRLVSKMGAIYWRVVQRCLNNDFGLEGADADADMGGLPLQMAFERHVVSELERCFA